MSRQTFGACPSTEIHMACEQLDILRQKMLRETEEFLSSRLSPRGVSADSHDKPHKPPHNSKRPRRHVLTQADREQILVPARS
jgi:hypothetical protein